MIHERILLFTRIKAEAPLAGAFVVFLFALAPLKAAMAQETQPAAQKAASGQQTKYLVSGGKRDLEMVYKTDGRRQLRLDLYYPATKDGPCPVVVYTHGGGWAAGNRYKAASGMFADVFQELLEQGFAIAPVSYRLAKKNSGITIRDCVIDCKDAVRYLAKNSSDLGIDKNRFYVLGDSAGGQIAQMLLLTSPDQLPGDGALAGVGYRMVAGVSWYGPCDFERTHLFNHDDRPGFHDRFGPRILGSQTEQPDKTERYREVSPVNYLTKDSPPLLMIQGDSDTTIPVKHAQFMKRRSEELRAPVEIMIIKNCGHNWRRVGQNIEPTREEITRRTVQFFVDQR